MRRQRGNRRAGRRIRWISAALGLLFLAGCGKGRDPDRQALPGAKQAAWLLSTNVIHVGDPLTAVLRVRHPPGSTIRWPDPGGESALLVREAGARTSEEDDGLLTSVRYRLTSFEIGEHLVATGSVRCLPPDGDPFELHFEPAVLIVRSALDAENDAPHDLRPPAAWQRPRPWVWIFGALAAAFLGVLALQLLRRKKARAEPAPPPPHETALAALRRLRGAGWIEEGRGEAFFVDVSAIVRRYLEERFGLRAPERTTEEFLREASVSGTLSDAHQGLTRDFLLQCDLVKFARHRPAIRDMEKALDAAERLVLETRPRPEDLP